MIRSLEVRWEAIIHVQVVTVYISRCTNAARRVETSLRLVGPPPAWVELELNFTAPTDARSSETLVLVNQNGWLT